MSGCPAAAPSLRDWSPVTVVTVWPGSRRTQGWDLGPGQSGSGLPFISYRPRAGLSQSPLFSGYKGPRAWDIFIGGARGQTQRGRNRSFLALLTDTAAVTATLCLEACSPGLPKSTVDSLTCS